MIKILGSAINLIYGVPERPERPVVLPPGITKARVRFRPRCFGSIYYREGDAFIHRLLLDAGDHFEVSDIKAEQGRNRKVAA